MSSPLNRPFSFSLATLLLLTTIFALVVAQFAMWRELTDARAEVEEVRRKYGHIRVENDQQTFVARIADNELGDDAYRIHVPPGRHDLIYLTDATFPDGGLDDPQPTKSISLNGWKEGADVVLSYKIYIEDGTPRVVVHTETEQFFDYRMKGFKDDGGPNEEWDLQTDPQAAFSADDTIQFM